MIEYEQALEAVLSNTGRLSTERVFIEDSVGRILTEDVYSKIEMPPFNKSAMDGYAVKSTDVRNAPVKLRCVGFIEAGQGFKKKVKNNECVKIMTGASLPESTDSVIMVENTRDLGECVELMKTGRRHENVCMQGEDIKKGQKVLAKGKLISASDIALLGTVGRRYIQVMKRPGVAVLNTGGEIVSLGRKLSGKRIYNSNGPQLLALLKSDGINPIFLGIAKDRPEDLRKAIKKGLKYEVLLISGGVSMGDYDLVPDTLESLGVKKIFHKVRCKPGKPLLFGTYKKRIVFGVPGNPVSNFLAYYIFIRPALLKLAGEKPYAPLFEEGVLEKAYHHKPGRKHFVLSRVARTNTRCVISPVESHGSADIFALSRANAFMIVDADVRDVKAGSKVKFIRWNV